MSPKSSLFWSTFFVLGLSFLWTLFRFPPSFRLKEKRISSSVWCSRSNSFSRRCTFTNLCFNKGFLLSVSKSSSIVGLDSQEDLKNIRASSVLNHTIGNLMLTVVRPSNPLFHFYEVVHHPVYFIHRFKPDNLFHILHDDLLPLYFAYNEICRGDVDECVRTHRLGFIDSHPIELNLEWYRLFTFQPPFKTFQEINSTVCYKTAHVWTTTETNFFKYGFKSTQGPLSPNLPAYFFYKFSNFILNRAHIERRKTNNALILLRKKSRLILNEEALIKVSQQVLSARINATVITTTLDISSESMTSLLSLAASSKFFIGMHGSGMALTLFLPLDSFVIELFPFGVNSTHVSPMKSLSTTPAIHFKYYSWVNLKEKNTVGHPEYPLLLGGSVNRTTYNCSNLPPVECCHDPKYLYCMYQDTFIDTTYESLLWRIQLKPPSWREGELIYKKWSFPGSVVDLKCAFMESYLKMFWLHPINHNPSMDYDVDIVFNGKASKFNTYSTEHTLFMGIEGKDAEVWVTTKGQYGAESVPVYAKCTLYSDSW